MLDMGRKNNMPLIFQYFLIWYGIYAFLIFFLTVIFAGGGTFIFMDTAWSLRKSTQWNWLVCILIYIFEILQIHCIISLRGL